MCWHPGKVGPGKDCRNIPLSIAKVKTMLEVRPQGYGGKMVKQRPVGHWLIFN
jgi:hypothetical protein